MKYKVGDYLANDHTVLFYVTVVIPGIVDLYGCYSIKHPESLRWLTPAQIEHEELAHVYPNIRQFFDAREGDLVNIGDGDTVRILARAGNACLLSQPKQHGLLQHVVTDIMKNMDEVPDHVEHMHKHNMTSYLQNSADDWYDCGFMALMNWKLVRE